MHFRTPRRIACLVALLCTWTLVRSAPAEDVTPVEPESTPQANTPNDHLFVHIEVFEMTLDDAEVAGRTDSEGNFEDLTDVIQAKLAAGEGRLRYIFDEPVIVGEKLKIESSSRVPFVRGITRTDAGATQKSVEYQNVGCIVKVETAWSPSAGDDDESKSWLIHSQLQFEISDLITDGSVKISDEVTAPVFLRMKQEIDWSSRIGDAAVAYHVQKKSDAEPDAGQFRCYVLQFRFDAAGK